MSEANIPSQIDVTRPSPARVYDHLLGGKANYAVDRQTAAQILRSHPDVRETAVENRRFLLRVVTELARQGVRQFLDLGAGLPTNENTHQVAQRIAPGAKVVYVDNDPMALAHARALLGDQADTGYVHADMRDVDQVLGAGATRRLIDFTQPVGLLVISVLHFIRDDPGGLLRRYVQALPAGSWTAMTHASATGMPAELLEQITKTYENAPNPLYFRPREEIEDMFAGLTLMEPGLVSVTDWPTPRQGPELTLPMLGAVGHKNPAG
ncbi:SAM-dependent methyltransferase [Actinomadura kijaniata]|uniref:SAM-dependent methyltransferase n=1 Tax=Actinomadura kijaniata TaxID=46161 RepID=UPI003F1A5A59